MTQINLPLDADNEPLLSCFLPHLLQPGPSPHPTSLSLTSLWLSSHQQQISLPNPLDAVTCAADEVPLDLGNEQTCALDLKVDGIGEAPVTDKLRLDLGDERIGLGFCTLALGVDVIPDKHG